MSVLNNSVIHNLCVCVLLAIMPTLSATYIRHAFAEFQGESMAYQSKEKVLYTLKEPIRMPACCVVLMLIFVRLPGSMIRQMSQVWHMMLYPL